MEIVDCKWEILNIHKKTIEITVERGDIFGDMNLSPVTLMTLGKAWSLLFKTHCEKTKTLWAKIRE